MARERQKLLLLHSLQNQHSYLYFRQILHQRIGCFSQNEMNVSEKWDDFNGIRIEANQSFEHLHRHPQRATERPNGGQTEKSGPLTPSVRTARKTARHSSGHPNFLGFARGGGEWQASVMQPHTCVPELSSIHMSRQF